MERPRQQADEQQTSLVENPVDRSEPATCATLAFFVFGVLEALPPASDPVTAIADATFDEAIAAARIFAAHLL
jgi:hypothetical protein